MFGKSQGDEEDVVFFQNPIGEPVIIGPEPRLGSSPRELPAEHFAVPDTVLDGAAASGIVIRGASLRGDEHRYYGTSRQDAMGIYRVADDAGDAFLVCVADGVGSQPLSQLGSAEACPLLRAAVQPLVSELLTADAETELPDLGQGLMERVAKELLAVAERASADPKELSTTLVGALIDANPPSPDARRLVLFGVGDSGAFLLRGGAFTPLFADQHDGAITGTGTNALPTSVGRAITRAGRLAPGDVLMVCTDGLSNPMRNALVTQRLAEWWGQGVVPPLPLFGWHLSFRAKSHSDDRTAVCVWG